MTGRERVAGGLRVRGTCKAGHVTEASTAEGRVTWEGPCAHEGCEHKVKATRRAPATVDTDPAAVDDDTTTEPASTPATPSRLKVVDYDQPPPRRDQHPDDDGRRPPRKRAAAKRAAPARPAAQSPADLHRQPDPAVEPGHPDPGADDRRAARRGRIRERITGRRQAVTQEKPRREFYLPY